VIVSQLHSQNGICKTLDVKFISQGNSIPVNFYSFTMHLDIITPLFVQMNAQLDCSRSVKTYIKIDIEMLLHVSV